MHFDSDASEAQESLGARSAQHGEWRVRRAGARRAQRGAPLENQYHGPLQVALLRFLGEYGLAVEMSVELLGVGIVVRFQKEKICSPVLSKNH